MELTNVMTPIFEWYVDRSGSKNGYEKDTCLREIGPHAQNMISILNSTTNIIGEEGESGGGGGGAGATYTIT